MRFSIRIYLYPPSSYPSCHIREPFNGLLFLLWSSPILNVATNVSVFYYTTCALFPSVCGQPPDTMLCSYDLQKGSNIGVRGGMSQSAQTSKFRLLSRPALTCTLGPPKYRGPTCRGLGQQSTILFIYLVYRHIMSEKKMGIDSHRPLGIWFKSNKKMCPNIITKTTTDIKNITSSMRLLDPKCFQKRRHT